MTHIYASIVHSLRTNYATFLKGDKSFQNTINKIRKFCPLPAIDQDVNHLNCYIKKTAKKKLVSSDRYLKNPTLTEEINLLRHWLSPFSGINWGTQIHHLILWMDITNSASDSCVYGGGGFSIKLKFYHQSTILGSSLDGPHTSWGVLGSWDQQY